MTTHHAQIDLPYTPQQVYDLVADFENYPKFLNHVAHARILRRQDNTLFCEQVFRVGPMRARFKTQTQLDPGRSIHVVCADSPFGTFDDRWTFAPGANGGTHVTCRTEYALRGGPLRVIIDKVLNEIFSLTIHAFERRARRLYEPHAPG
jgi:coenzyme Q-binding protein COQ10